MPLIITDYFHKDNTKTKKNFSQFFLHIDNKYLENLHVDQKSELIGLIKEARPIDKKAKNIKSLNNIKVTLKPSKSLKRIYFTKECIKNMKDHINSEFGLWAKITVNKLIRNEKKYHLYRNRKIKINNLQNPDIHCINQRYFMTRGYNP